MLGILDSMMQMNRLSAKWDRMMHERGSAETAGKAECTNCGVCCWQRPCTFTEEEFSTLAKHLNLEPKEAFAEYVAIDEIGDGLTLIAIRHGQGDIAGRYVPCDRTYDDDAPCIFRNEQGKRCEIHDVKPIQGKTNQCWDNDEELRIAKWDKDALIALGWDGDKDWGDDEY